MVVKVQSKKKPEKSGSVPLILHWPGFITQCGMHSQVHKQLPPPGCGIFHVTLSPDDSIYPSFCRSSCHTTHRDSGNRLMLAVLESFASWILLGAWHHDAQCVYVTVFFPWMCLPPVLKPRAIASMQQSTGWQTMYAFSLKMPLVTHLPVDSPQVYKCRRE